MNTKETKGLQKFEHIRRFATASLNSGCRTQLPSDEAARKRAEVRREFCNFGPDRHRRRNRVILIRWPSLGGFTSSNKSASALGGVAIRLQTMTPGVA